MFRKRNTLFSPIAVHEQTIFWGAGCYVFALNTMNNSWVINGLKRPDAVRSISVSADGELVAVGDDSKAVAVFNLNDQSLLREWTNQEKKVTCVSLVNSRLLFGDRYGDVREVNLATVGDEREEVGESSGKLALGHLCSSITCMTSNQEQNVLVTADGDEKIRVSSLTSSFATKAFCLGHKEFVSAVRILPKSVMASASADETVKLWNFKTGDLLASLNLKIGPLVSLEVLALNENEILGVAVADHSDIIVLLKIDIVRNDAGLPVSASISKTASYNAGVEVLNAAILSNRTVFITNVKGELLSVCESTGEMCTVCVGTQIGLGEKEIQPVDINFWRWRGPPGGIEEGEEEVDKTGRRKRRKVQPPAELLAEIDDSE